MACQQSVGINGIGFYTAETFVAAGFSSGKAGTIAYACMQVPFTILGAILMDRSGRRPLIMVNGDWTTKIICIHYQLRNSGQVSNLVRNGITETVVTNIQS
ncbi:sugar transporter ERD6-like 16 [Vigna unguiculata]|uniref:sugar transporter ERD6-like 16 n=1 Tax=Vigna unguiculata TaxID=3917 RepID=UPI001016C02B|nr:sugar transporter ERD6-like 16 [Vigna unguiculata]